MTDSENSQPQDDSDEDIYKDIPEFNFEDELAKLEGSKESYKQEANDLSEKVKALTEENKELKKSNEVLKRNLSTLLKTAQAEVQRKDAVIVELRNKVESFTFRRNKTTTSDKYTSTDDLDSIPEIRYEPDKLKNFKNRSKSFENQTGSDGERRLNQEDDKRKENSAGKEENLNCDNKKSDYKGDSKTNYRHSDNGRASFEGRREKKSHRYEDNSGYRRSYRENHRDHLKYDSFDKKRHSRSSENRFPSRHRSSRERRDERRRSSERRRRNDDSPNRRRRTTRNEKSRSREISRGSKESSLEKVKILDKDPAITTKEQCSKFEAADSGKGTTEVADGKKRNGQENGTTRSKEKRSGKQEKRSNLDIFSTKSPLDALYNDMVSSRSTSRNTKPGMNLQESDLEEGELCVTQPHLESFESQADEDWALSFKNERPNDPKPMTLYSRRMMKKFSTETKITEKPEVSKKVEEVEKEPGELTDDENIVESSKEFQELAKVASIESEKVAKTFKEPVKKEEKPTEPVETPKEVEKPTADTTEEPSKECREVIEFSPFKNNYKLIEISPIKPRDKQHVLEFYSKKAQPDPNSSDGKQTNSKPSDTSEDWKNSSSEKDSEAELKIVIPPPSESPKEDKAENKSGRGKRQKKETEKPEEKTLKRKRKSNEVVETDTKKRKIEPRNTRSKRNSKTEPEPKPVETKTVVEDISNFEFFKPAAKEVPRTPIDIAKSVCTTTDYKMTATMSVTGVVRLETPNKCVEKLKNLMFNEQMIFNVLDTKSSSQFSPLMEMTPRRMLKNDLMLTDSEDDSIIKRNVGEAEEAEDEEQGVEEEEDGEGNDSEGDSDSGASDFVDLL